MADSYLFLYFSGTGNTKFVVEYFAKHLQKEPTVFSIEHDDVDYSTLIQSHDSITFGYPIYESMMPHIMIEFIEKHKHLIVDKTISVIITQMLFSGDGAGLLPRMLKKQGNTILHTIHINMPNNLTDVHLFKAKSLEDRGPLLVKATQKMDSIIQSIHRGYIIRMGRKWYSRALGLFTQRLYAKPLYKGMRKKLKVNHELCISCNQCVPLCPTNNLSMKDNKILTHNNCTTCYRCINTCPTKALSLFMKHGPKVQYIRDSYN